MRRFYICLITLVGGPLLLLYLTTQGPGLAAPAEAQAPQQQAPAPLDNSKAPLLAFQIVPDFLKYAPTMNLGEVLGVAVNSRGEIVVLNHPGSATTGPLYGNATTQLLVFDRSGKFVREIGQGVYGLGYAHAVRFDRYDNLWVVDKGTNAVVKFNPAGYVTMNLGRRPEGYEGEYHRPEPPEAVPVDGYFNGPTDIGWDAQDNIYVSEGYVNNRIAKFDKNGNWIKTWGQFGEGGEHANLNPGHFRNVHTMQIDRQGNIYACQGADRCVVRLRTNETGTGELVQVLAGEFEGQPFNQPNDLAIDTSGGLYFTDPNYRGADQPPTQPVQGVYYIAAGGEVTRVIDDLPRPNGILVSPDGKKLFVANIELRQIMEYEITQPGRLGPGRVLFTGDADLDGRGPDGMALDSSGRLYTTYKSIVVVAPGGERPDLVFGDVFRLGDARFGQVSSDAFQVAFVGGYGPGGETAFIGQVIEEAANFALHGTSITQVSTYRLRK